MRSTIGLGIFCCLWLFPALQAQANETPASGKNIDSRALGAAILAEKFSGKLAPAPAEKLTPLRIWLGLPIEALELSSEIGLKNLFETGQSGGASKLARRMGIENYNLGKNLGIEPAELRPKSAFLLHVEKGPIALSDQYGGAFLELKPSVFPRATYTHGDSLESAGAKSVYFETPALGDFKNLYQSSLSYMEAQIWGALPLEDVQNIILPEKHFQEHGELVKKLADKHGFGVKTFSGSLEKFDLKSLTSAYTPAPAKKNSLKPGVRKLLELYQAQNSLAAKGAIVNELGKNSSAAAQKALQILLTKERNVLEELKAQGKGSLLRAQERLLQQLRLQKGRGHRIYNAYRSLGEHPHSGPLVKGIANELASRYAAFPQAEDAEELLRQSERGKPWDRHERAVIRKVFKGRWQDYGLHDDEHALIRSFVSNLDKQIPDWWQDPDNFGRFLQAADWDLDKYSAQFSERFQGLDPETVIRDMLEQKLHERYQQIEKFGSTNASVRALNDFTLAVLGKSCSGLMKKL